VARIPFQLILAALVATGCAEISQPPSQGQGDRVGVWVPDRFATILRTSSSELANPTFAVVGDTLAWRDMWTRAWPQASAPALPAIDFVLYSVVVVGRGSPGGQGYGVEVDSIVMRTFSAEVFFTESLPGTGCPVASGSTAPVHMIRVIGHPPVTTWSTRTVAQDCTP
jgi:hypothetical protein